MSIRRMTCTINETPYYAIVYEELLAEAVRDGMPADEAAEWATVEAEYAACRYYEAVEDEAWDAKLNAMREGEAS